MTLLNHFDHVILADTEYRPRGDGTLEVRCVCALELRSGTEHRIWVDGECPCPYPIGPGSAFIAFYAAAEVQAHISLGWPVPDTVIDLQVEWLAMACGKRPEKKRRRLIDALDWFNLDHLSAAAKDEFRELALTDKRNSEFSDRERAELLEYCWQDVDSLRKLLPKVEKFLCP